MYFHNNTLLCIAISLIQKTEQVGVRETVVSHLVALYTRFLSKEGLALHSLHTTITWWPRGICISTSSLFLRWRRSRSCRFYISLSPFSSLSPLSFCLFAGSLLMFFLNLWRSWIFQDPYNKEKLSDNVLVLHNIPRAGNYILVGEKSTQTYNWTNVRFWWNVNWCTLSLSYHPPRVLCQKYTVTIKSSHLTQHNLCIV